MKIAVDTLHEFSYKHDDNLDAEVSSLSLKAEPQKIIKSEFTQNDTSLNTQHQDFTFKGQAFDNPYSNIDQYNQQKAINVEFKATERKLEDKLAEINNKDQFFKKLNENEVERKEPVKNRSIDTKKREQETESLTAAQMLVSGLISMAKKRSEKNFSAEFLDKKAIANATKNHLKSKNINELCESAKKNIDLISNSNNVSQIKDSVNSLGDDLKTINMKMKSDLSKSENMRGVDLKNHLENIKQEKKVVDKLIDYGKDNSKVVEEKSKLVGSEFSIKESLNNLKESVRKIMDSIKEITQKFIPNNSEIKI